MFEEDISGLTGGQIMDKYPSGAILRQTDGEVYRVFWDDYRMLLFEVV